MWKISQNNSKESETKFKPINKYHAIFVSKLVKSPLSIKKEEFLTHCVVVVEFFSFLLFMSIKTKLFEKKILFAKPRFEIQNKTYYNKNIWIELLLK